MKKSDFWYKLFHWEYWPSFMFYLPILPYAFYLALRARSLVFYSATNPAIHNSGNGMESKFATIQLIPEVLRPKTVLVKTNSSFEDLLEKIAAVGIQFPLIIKPDIGFRGLLVQKIATAEELKSFINTYPIQLIIQEFIDLPNECGIFYYRLPDEQSGHITSLTLKEYLSVVGDGCSTIGELILKESRASLYYDLIVKLHGTSLEQRLEKNEHLTLNVIGNHCKGTRFIEGNDLITQDLVQAMDKLNHEIDGWYFGRIDLKYNDFNDIIAGHSYKILEINGIISEPTHIYDASTQTYFKALKEIAKHWKIIYRIATINHYMLHFPFASTKAFVKEMFAMNSYTRKIKKLTR